MAEGCEMVLDRAGKKKTDDCSFEDLFSGPVCANHWKSP